MDEQWPVLSGHRGPAKQRGAGRADPCRLPRPDLRQGRLWVGNDGGSYRSDDNGATFANLNATLSITQFNAGLSGPPYALLMGNSRQWHAYPSPRRTVVEPLAGDGGVTLVDPRNPLIRYATYAEAVLIARPTRGSTRRGWVRSRSARRRVGASSTRCRMRCHR